MVCGQNIYIGDRGIYSLLCRDMYEALTKRLEPDEGRRIDRYYPSEDEINDQEREMDGAWEDELLECAYGDSSRDEE
jgi:hypothetical protein